MSLFGGLGGTQQTQQQASPFSFSSTPSLFGTTQPQTLNPAPAQNLFPTAIPQPQPSIQQPLVFPTLPPPPTPPVFLVQKAVDPQRGPQPAAYSTRWDDLHPESQKILLSVEGRILEYRDESFALEQNERLYNSSAIKKEFEEEASSIRQNLGSLATSIQSEEATLKLLLSRTQHLLQGTELAVRSFLRLRSQFPRFGGPSPSPADFYTGTPTLPSPYLEHTVARFEKELEEYQLRVEELERMLMGGGGGTGGGWGGEGGKAGAQAVAGALPAVLHNVHDFFIHVAAQVERVHQQVESGREAFLKERKRAGIEASPFLEADRREASRKEALSRGLHPGLLALPPGALAVAQGGITAPAVTTGNIFGAPSSDASKSSGFPSLFGGASSAVAPTPSLFGGFGGTIPGTSPGSSLFAAPGAVGPTTPSLFGGSTPGAAPSSGLFGGGATGSLFGTGAGGGGGGFTGNLFGTPQTPTPALTPGFGAPGPSGSPLGGTPSLFGAPAAPQMGGGLFGAAQPQTGLFGAGGTTAPTVVKPKPRSARRK